jgi:hypothetical protein
MLSDESKTTGKLRCGALMMAAVTTFLSLGGCDMGPGSHQPLPGERRQEEKDGSQAGPGWHGGSGIGGYSRPPIGGEGGGTHRDPSSGTVRGGFGNTGSMHAASE